MTDKQHNKQQDQEQTEGYMKPLERVFCKFPSGFEVEINSCKYDVHELTGIISGLHDFWKQNNGSKTKTNYTG